MRPPFLFTYSSRQKVASVMSDQNSTNSAIPVKKTCFCRTTCLHFGTSACSAWSHKRDTCYSGLGQSVERSHRERVLQDTSVPHGMAVSDHILLDDADRSIETFNVAQLDRQRR